MQKEGWPSLADILELVGNTPMILLSKLCPNPRVKLLAKAEWFNPSGSVKDRAIFAMIKDAEMKGLLAGNKTLLDSTSGNAGISYAMAGASSGYRVKLAVPASISKERIRILKAFGTDLIFTSSLEGSDGAMRRASEIYESEPKKFVYLNQYANPANWKAHYDTTGPEIVRQTGGRVTHFVAGIGTSGTLMGTGRRLKEHNPRISIVSVEPDAPFHGIEGLKHIASSIVPSIYDPSFPDTHMEVSTEEAQTTVKRLAREEGILSGTSSGAAVAACLLLARELKEGTIVTILPDGGERYLGERYWEEQDEPSLE